MTAAKTLDDLRKPFPAAVIGKLPKQGVTLDFVGHAAVTDRLLTVDPEWSWEPVAWDEQGLPLYDRSGGLWIRLTVLGVTRLGYGDGPDPKQRIGDAIRNAAMRFGVALDLWTKGELESQDPNGGGGDIVRTTPRERGPVDRQPKPAVVQDAARLDRELRGKGSSAPAERGPIPTEQDPWADAPVQRPPVVTDPKWVADVTARTAGCADLKELRGIRTEVVEAAKNERAAEKDCADLLALIDEAGADLRAKYEAEQAKAAAK